MQTPEKKVQGKQTICSRGYQRWRSILYESNIRGISSTEALIKTVWLMNSIYFGLRGCDERLQMRWSDVKMLADADGIEYLEYCERQTKRRSGEEPWNIRPVKPKTFGRPDGAPEKDPVSFYKFYPEKDLAQCRASKHLYYLGLNNSNDCSKCWFKESAIKTYLVNENNGRISWLRATTNPPWRTKANDAKTER